MAKKQTTKKAKPVAVRAKKTAKAQSVKTQPKAQKKNNKLIYIIIAAVVVLALAGLGYWMFSQKSTSTASSSTSQSSTTPSGLTLSLLGGKLIVTKPDGWEKGYETTAVKTINGTQYRIAFQPQSSDYLKLASVGGYASEIGTVTTSQGTTLHILKIGKTQDATNVVVSTCAPENGFGCSPDLSGYSDPRKLYMSLSPATSSSTDMPPLDYNLPATATAISDFQKIAASLPL